MRITNYTTIKRNDANYTIVTKKDRDEIFFSIYVDLKKGYKPNIAKRRLYMLKDKPAEEFGIILKRLSININGYTSNHTNMRIYEAYLNIMKKQENKKNKKNKKNEVKKMRTKTTLIEKYTLFGETAELKMLRNKEGLFKLFTIKNNNEIVRETDYMNMSDIFRELCITSPDLQDYYVNGDYYKRNEDLSVPLRRYNNLIYRGGKYENEERIAILKRCGIN